MATADKFLKYIFMLINHKYKILNSQLSAIFHNFADHLAKVFKISVQNGY